MLNEVTARISARIAAKAIELTADSLPTLPNSLPIAQNPLGGGLFKTVYQQERYSLVDVLQLKDIYLFNALNESAQLIHENPLALPEQLYASIVPKDVFASPWAPFFMFCFRVLPVYLNMKFGYSYSFVQAKTQMNRSHYEDAIDEAISTCKSNGMLLPAVRKSFTALKLYPSNKDALLGIGNLFRVLKPKIRPTLKTSAERTLFLRFNYVYTDDEANEPALEDIFKVASRIPDLMLRRFVKSVQFDSNVVEYKFLTARQSTTDITIKTFGTAAPTQKQIEKLYNKKPDVYKDWRKRMNEVCRQGKALLQDAWDEADLDKVVPVEVARNLCSEIGLQCPIDPEFEGMVSLGATPGVIFAYYTKYGLEIEGTVGHNVVMNPKYTKDDNTYVCTCTPANGISSERYRFYTKAYRNRSTGELFTKARSIVDCIEDVRITITQDMKRGDWGTRNLCALVCRVIDLTAARIGNRGSEARDIYGVHNLKMKHLRWLKSGLKISYKGKRGIKHNHLITDVLTMKIIQALTKGRGPNDYVFSANGKVPISVISVNKYLNTIGFPGTAHSWRKYHANTLFEQAIKDGYAAHTAAMQKKMARSKKFVPTDPDTAAIFKAAVEVVAERLQNTPGVCIRSYIDANLMMNVFLADGKTPPAPVKKAFEDRKNVDPDAEVDD